MSAFSATSTEIVKLLFSKVEFNSLLIEAAINLKLNGPSEGLRPLVGRSLTPIVSCIV